MRRKKPQYEEISEHEVFTFAPHMRQKKYFRCVKHDYVFVEGCCCPRCESPRRSIFDDWQPSQGDETPPEEERPSFVDIIAYADQQKPLGTFKVVKCSLHNMPYIEGLNECPECRCWAS